MAVWLMFVVVNLFLPLLMLGVGWWFQKSPPKKINPFVGYRTRMSMKNEQTWRFAHETCGRLWVRLGAWLLPASVVAMLPALGQGEEIAGWVGTGVCLAQCAVAIGSIPYTERALRRAFFPDGSPRKKT